MEKKYKIFSKVPFVLIMDHAVERARERCGLEPSDIRNTIIRLWHCAYCRVNYQGHPEKWIPISGPLGEGTIVITFERNVWATTTVRDSNKFTQAERRNKKLTRSLGDLLRGFRLEGETTT